uniref:Histidine kinase n=1 Tax=Meloidogyne hapla TaxID=6305 RepID=A0A1I8BPB4_MELHA
MISSYIRSKIDETGKLSYVLNYDALFMLPFIHAIITLFVYDYFLKKQDELNQNFIKSNAKQDTEIYFKKLNTQWN